MSNNATEVCLDGNGHTHTHNTCIHTFYVQLGMERELITAMSFTRNVVQ